MSETKPLYTTIQTVFSLCTISNIAPLFNHSRMVREYTSPAIKALLADPEIQTFIGEWKIVWGPYVEVPILSNVAANALFIAHNESTDEYIVSIAGTDPSSIYEWVFEDFHINHVIDWPHDEKGKVGKISAGSYIGLETITKFGHYFFESGTALDYLKKVNAKKVYVTGHSLGGTLAPLFSLYLASAMPETQIDCYRFAGLTPSDDQFNAYYNTVPNITTYTIWNQNDVAPHLFQFNILDKIKTIFEPQINWGNPIIPDVFFDLLIDWSKKYNYTQLPDSTLLPHLSPFTFPLYPNDTIILPPPSGKATNPSSYLGQATCQHVASYSYHLDVVDGFLSRVTEVMNQLGHGELINGPFFTAGCPKPS